MFCFSVIRGSTSLSAGAVRPDDHAAVRGMDSLSHQRTVGAIGIVFTATPTVIIPRSDAKPERTNLNAGPVRICA